MKVFLFNAFPQVILVFIILSLAHSQEAYKKVIHYTDQNAKCIDGSPPAVYIHQGTQKDKFFIFLNGGGACLGYSLSQVLESCYQRSKTILGSSKNLPQELKIGGIFSTEADKSKFASWTKIFIEYCDGSLHQGSNDTPVKYKDTLLYFRGAVNTRSHFKWLVDNFDFSKASKVILSGSSAGAIAAFAWTTYVRGLLVDTTALYTVVDSGVFMNFPSAETGLPTQLLMLENLFKIANQNEKTPIKLCNNFYVGQEHRCLMLQYAFTSLVSSKLLLIQSQYDSEAIKGIFTSATCPAKGEHGMTLANCSKSQLSNIQEYRKQYLNFLSLFMQNTKFSSWSISCSNHVYTPYDAFYNVQSQKVPQRTGETVRNVIQRYVLNNQRPSVLDQVPWPQNKACAY